MLIIQLDSPGAVVSDATVDGLVERIHNASVAIGVWVGPSGAVALGPGNDRRHLFLKKGRALDMTLTGDPAAATAGLRPLGALVQYFEQYLPPSLRPYEPVSFAMSAKEGALAGGCRPWTLPEPLAESVFAPRIVPAKGHGDWPTGASPASVCLEDKRYVVTFRPLLPGERP